MKKNLGGDGRSSRRSDNPKYKHIYDILDYHPVAGYKVIKKGSTEYVQVATREEVVAEIPLTGDPIEDNEIIAIIRTKTI